MLAGDDAKNVKLIDISLDSNEYNTLYANHKDFVEMSLNYI